MSIMFNFNLNYTVLNVFETKSIHTQWANGRKTESTLQHFVLFGDFFHSL